MGFWIGAKCDPMVLKQLFFQKLQKIAQQLGLRPQTRIATGVSNSPDPRQ